MFIRTKPGAWVADVDSPVVARLSASILAHAVVHRDEDDWVFEIVHHDRHWTISHEDIEILDVKENIPCLN